TRYALALGLHAAGCRNALDLGAHPGRGGMAFTRVLTQTDSMTSEERPVHPKMQLRASEMVSRSPEAFFYVTQSEPGQGMSPRASGLTWTPSAGDQPAPSEWPALWESSITLGALPVRVLRVDPGRLRYALTASTLEPLLQGRPTPRRRLPESMR